MQKNSNLVLFASCLHWIVSGQSFAKNNFQLSKEIKKLIAIIIVFV